MSKTNAFLQIHLLLVLLITGGLTGCANGNQSQIGGNLGVVSTLTITDTVETSGNLSANQLETLTWGTSGLIDQVNVKVGQKVKAGEVLATLRADSVPADIVVAQSDLANAQNNLKEMQDSSLSYAEAQLTVINARKDVEEAQNNLDALDYPRASDTLIKNVEAQIKEQERTVTFYTRRYKEVQHHADGDPQKTQAELNLTNTILKLNELKATLNWYIAKPTQADYDEAQAELDIAKAKLEAARRSRDRVKSGADPLEIAAAQAKVDAAQAEVNAMNIIAPFDGEVIFVQSTPGSSVSKGVSAIGMVNRNTVKIDVLIDETSIGAISVGDEAQVTMDSLPSVTLKGKVTLINPIGTTVNGLVKYTVTVALEPTDDPLLFGATANVILLTSEPHSMLAVPVGAVQTNNQGEYVLVVKSDGSYQRVEIQSGDLSGNLVTVAASDDLKEGDQVVVGTTSSSSTSSSGSNNGGGVPNGGPGGGGPGGMFP